MTHVYNDALDQSPASGRRAAWPVHHETRGLDHLRAGYDEHPICFHRGDLGKPGEVAEGRQHRAFGGEPEAGKALALASLSVQRYARMKMPGQDIAVR